MSHNTKMLGITAHFRRQDGKVDPPPPEFDRSRYTYDRTSNLTDSQLRYTRRALEGRRRGLLSAFTWVATPQGHDYWCNIHDGTTDLLPEDEDYIEWLLEEYS